MIETVIGYGNNHMKLPLNLLFKEFRVYEKSDSDCDSDCESIENENRDRIVETVEITKDYSEEQFLAKINEIKDNGSKIILVLQDDIYCSENDDRETLIESEDDYFSMILCEFVSKEYGCTIGQSICFNGIIVASGSCEKGVRVCEIELENAKKFVEDMWSQDRFPDDCELILIGNCCS